MFLSMRFLIIFLVFLNGCTTFRSTQTPEIFKTLNDSIQQVILVEDCSGSGIPQTLTLWEKKNKTWVKVSDPILAVVGRNGIAKEGEKREGDGKTPSGVYPLGPAFGYADSILTGLDYRQVTKNDFWVDDIESPQYNQWVQGTPQAKSFEQLRRDDDLYKYGVVINYNVDPIVPGNGSAIFLHVWRGAGQGTAGCVAVAEKDIVKILKWLDIDSRPVIVLISQ